MTFLPIVERELTLAARRRFTFALRVLAALVAMVVGGGYLIILTVSPFGAGRAPGAPLFGILAWLGLIASLFSGLFLTSDSLSEEKREGTLGFLFLTDLRGYDVVLGKLFATSMRAAFAMLAMFPILAITLILGGVEAGQFWKTMFALLNGLLFSLVSGMLVSAISQSGQRALAGTLILMAMWTFGGFILDSGLAALQGRSRAMFFSLTSPLHVFRAVDGWSGLYWQALVVNLTIIAVQMVSACVLVRRTWQEGQGKAEVSGNSRRRWWQRAKPEQRQALRQRWLERDPVMWLSLRERGTVSYVWLWPTLLLAGITAGSMGLMPVGAWPVFWHFLASTVTLILYLSVASQASVFFAEIRRTRLLELLLATPLEARRIVFSAWRSLLFLFSGPVVLLLVLRLVGGFSVAAPVGFSFAPNSFVMGFTVIMGALVTVANLVALSWFALWMGMTSRNALLATLKSLAAVQLVPLFLISIASAMVLPLIMLPRLLKSAGTGLTPNAYTFWYPLVQSALAALLTLGKDYFFWRWSYQKLMHDFREQATRAVTPVITQPNWPGATGLPQTPHSA